MECARQPMLTSRRIRSELSGWIWMHHVPVSVLRAGGGAWCMAWWLWLWLWLACVSMCVSSMCFHVCFFVFGRFPRLFLFPHQMILQAHVLFAFFSPFYSFWSLERLFRFPLLTLDRSLFPPRSFSFPFPAFPFGLVGLAR